jgi:NhaA family Na+:H+ antiporter
VVRPVQQFLHLEVAGGVVLAVATVVALVWANVDEASYSRVWSTDVDVTVGSWSLVKDLRYVVNDGLMALFFFVIGLEIKRELAVGELADRRAALLPVFAAAGGMVVPALLFLALVDAEARGGWGIPVATDIAFALAALAALGRRVPPALAVFLLAVAVIDDIGAITIIAVFYSDAIAVEWLAVAGVGLTAVAALWRIHVRYLGAYVALGLVVWFATLESGVHATIAGVALGLLTPARPFQPPAAVSASAYEVADATSDEPDDPDADAHEWRRLAWLSREAISPLARIEHALHPWTSYVVLPLFALANAGIALDRDAIDAAVDAPVTLAVVVGLVVGKTAGLLLGTVLATRLGLAQLPAGVGWRHVTGVGALAGIGFTVSLFIASLAYDDPALQAAAKVGILVGSAIAFALGMAVLLAAGRGSATGMDGGASRPPY